MLYADIIVPLPLQGNFTYSIPDHYSGRIAIGCRVIVQFGKKKFYTGIVHNLHEEKEFKEGIKEITSLLDDSPVVLPQQLKFWEWISFYYMCTLGEVYKAALPSALKLESETYVYLNEFFEAKDRFTPNEEKVFYSLSPTKPLRISEIEKLTGINNVIPYIKSLADKGAALLNENVQRGYAARTTAAVRLARNFTDKELSGFLDELKRARKQLQVLHVFLALKDEAGNPDDFFITKKELISEAGVTSAIIDSLAEKGILEIFAYEVSRFNYGEFAPDAIKELSLNQQKAFEDIKTLFNEKQVVLLHGVTSSGKTEIYIRLIEDMLNQGKQVLYLLPEIALTTQITERLKAVFGNKLLVYHSRFNENERAETWHSLLNSTEGKVVLGARSAVFLPLSNPGLIIVDEEHDSSYKQHDPAPRYNGKNAAVMLAGMQGAKVLLGSATPSIESYYNALSGRYGLVNLDKRHRDIELPEVLTINTKELRKRKQMKSILSPPLVSRIKETLERNEQIILFQNRRGFAPMLECKTCSWTPQCLHCDVSLTYHKGQRAMVCHYCGAVYVVPTECPDCLTPTLEIQGYGTERVEELVSEELPEANLLRMDLDTTRSKRAYEHIIADFESGKSDILIGTQMVSKGLDFDNVSLVGILNADSMLNYPDFRAHERAFQLMMQVSGRAGRKNRRGTVLLQTAHPSHPVISFVREHNFLAFYNTQIAERQLFRYPPFYRLIEIIIRNKEEIIADSMATELSRLLRESFNDRVLGPSRPGVAWVQSLHIRKILLKIENQASPQKVREIIEVCRKYVCANPAYKSVLVHYDVDPM